MLYENNQTPCGRRGAACGRCVRPSSGLVPNFTQSEIPNVATAVETGNSKDE
ncbi:MAG: hypothetical protein ACYTXC_18210 [Nostoc sp.]